MRIKRLIAAVLSLSIVLCNAQMISAKTDIQYGLQESFNGYVTNDQPSKGTFTAETSRVIEIAPQDKAYSIKSTYDYGVIKAVYDKIGIEGQFVFQADVYIKGDNPIGKINIADSAGKVMNIFAMTDNGFGISGGLSVSGFGKDVKNTIALVYNPKSGMGTFYLNGKECASNWFIKNGVSGINKVEFDFTIKDNSETEMILDNLYVYTGTELVKSAELPKDKYNEQEIEYEEPVQEDVCFFYREFGEIGFSDFDNMLDQSGDNIAEVRKEENGNSYLYLEKITDKQLIMPVFPIAKTNMNTLAQATRYTTQQVDISGDDFKTAGNLLVMEGPLNAATVLVTVNGDALYAGTTKIATLKKGEWTTVSAVCDFIKSTYDVYINYEQVASGLPLNKATKYFARWRPIFDSSAPNGAIWIDNMSVYNSKEPHKIEFEEGYKPQSYVTADTQKLKLLKSFDAINYKANTASVATVKSKVDNLAYIADNGVYLNIEKVAKLYGKPYDAEKTTIGGRTVKGAMSIDGQMYAPYASLLKDNFSKYSMLDNRGIILISSNPINADIYGYEKENDLWDIVNYTMYDRPNAEELAASISETRPRVIYTQAQIDELQEKLKTSALKQETLETAIETANGMLESEPVTYVLAGGSLLNQARTAINRMEKMGVAYLLTDDEKYAERMWEEAYSISQFPDYHPTHFLDCGELSAAMAIAYDWLYDYLTEEQRKIIADSIYKNSIVIGLKAFRHQGGTGFTHWVNQTGFNQTAVNCGGLIMAASAIMEEYPEECSELISLAVKSLEAFTQSFYPSGAYPESTTYYSYAMSYWVRGIQTLKASYGTDFNLTLAPMMKDSTNYSLATTSYVQNNNFHDTENSNLKSAIGFFDWFAYTYGDKSLSDIRNYVTSQYGNIQSDLFYGSDGMAESISAATDMYMERVEVMSLRSAWDEPAGAFISAHAGDALPGHGHVDTGTFVIDMLGKRFAEDVGADKYSEYERAATAESTRNKGAQWVYATRPEGHNCLVINPRYESGHTLDAFAPFTAFEAGERNAFAIADLSETYSADVTEYSRGYYMGDDRRSVMVRDELTLKAESEMYWFMNTKADIELIDDTTAMLSRDGARVKVKLVTNVEDAKFSVMDAKRLDTSPEYGVIDLSAFKKLTVHMPKAEGEVYIQVKFIPESDPNVNDEVVNMPFSTWTIQEGERQFLPKVDMIYLNGETLKSFNKNNLAYSVNIPESDQTLPTITASASDMYKVEITPAADAHGYTYIKVSDKANPKNSQTYTIGYFIIPKMPDVGEYERLQVYDIFTTPKTHERADSLPININDDDLTTRYAVEGAGEFLAIDLGKPQLIEAVAMSVYYGASRKNFFDIEISNDGVNFEKIFSGESSGTTEEVEVIDIPDVTARYIRYVMTGSTAGAWNSYNEFGALRRLK